MRRLCRIAQLVRIERLVPGGQGMGRLEDGRPVFATGTFPGDLIQLETAEDRGSFVKAREYSFSQESEERVLPLCADCARCGGCDWMWISDAAQRRSKGSVIEQALSRIGKVSPPEAVQVHAAPEPLRYRSRVRLQIKAGRVGFFSRGTHELVSTEDCKVSTEELWKLVGQIRTVVAAAPQAFEAVSSVEVRVFRGELPQRERASVYFAMEKSDKGSASVLRALRGATSVLAENALVRFSTEAPLFQEFSPAPGVVAQAPVGGFTQVNEGVNEMLVERVLLEVKQAFARRFLDLYCGSGNFSLPLLHAGLHGVGVEASPEAILAARSQAEKDGLKAHFYAEECASYLARSEHAPGSFDVVIVDPPRAGAKDCIQGLLELRAPLLLMIACDPASLARDVGELTRSGYRLRKVEGFDMFPQTHHVETLAILELDESPRLSRPAS